MLVKYISQKNGGNCWLNKQNCIDLKKYGWRVEWVTKNGICASVNNKSDYMEILSVKAEKEFKSIKEALIEFQNITSENVDSEGCECCNPPHNFTWKEKEIVHHISGKECAIYLK